MPKGSDVRFPAELDMSRVPRGYNHMTVWQTVYKDQQREMLLVLYTYRQNDSSRPVPFEPLINVFWDHTARSDEWMRLRARVVGLLIDYVAAVMEIEPRSKVLKLVGGSPSRIIKRFAQAVLNGSSFLENGQVVDPLGLYWPSRKEDLARRLLLALQSVLAALSYEPEDWSAKALSKLHDPAAAVRMAHHYSIRRNRSLLAHLSDPSTGTEKGHPFGGIFPSVSRSDATHRFPAKYIWPLIFQGFRSKSTNSVDETAQLITLLLFAGGSRISELLNLFVTDVQWIDGEPMVFVHHPRDGDIHVGGEKLTRLQYLRKQKSTPRHRRRKRGQAGHKGLAGDDVGAQLIWLPIKELQDELSAHLKRYVTQVRPQIMRLRKAKGLPDHGYLFVGSGHVFGDHTNPIGTEYTIAAFRTAWKLAINRLSVIYDDPDLEVAKTKGTTPHGARHFYGTFLKTIGCDGHLIAKCMHHKSPFSHLRYTELSPREIADILKLATSAAPSLASLHATIPDALRRQSSQSVFY